MVYVKLAFGDLDDLVLAASAGDPDVTDVVTQAVRHLGRGLANLVNITNHAHLVVGGELSARFCAWNRYDTPSPPGCPASASARRLWAGAHRRTERSRWCSPSRRVSSTVPPAATSDHGLGRSGDETDPHGRRT
ncbi:hypothetical protein [Actinoallomurus soli]|uniref:hypothetical protein n=1 Tax=Actinoallomurus soli TaxID=2952535 RepID=UPI0020931222|nr:hypothetical protein [Actinoallomurus soli]MCO5972530.1 hypothetical protein [Actinoallomurus soli]